MAWANAESEVRFFIEKMQVPFLRSPMGKGVMPDDHPLSVAAAPHLGIAERRCRLLMGASVVNAQILRSREIVIASAAKQSRGRCLSPSGLLRRYAPRNDNKT
jgi:hypothetical protein